MTENTGRFFKITSPPAFTLINVGGEQFHAAAVALIDYLQNSLLINELMLKKILTSYYQYFPQEIPKELGFSTVKERMAYLLNSKNLSKLIEHLAYVLRQLTVDYLYENYLNLEYREIFMQLSEDTLVSHLREPQVILPVKALHALSHALNLPLTISFKERDKELRKREEILDTQRFALVIQIQDEHYYPAVKNPSVFSHLRQLNVLIKPIAEENPCQEESVNNILSLINADNQRLLGTYKQQRQKILCMVHAGELSYTQLVTLYCSLLPEANAFITSLEVLSQPVVGEPTRLQQEKIELLASAFATCIAEGKLSADQFFDSLESNCNYSNAV